MPAGRTYVSAAQRSADLAVEYLVEAAFLLHQSPALRARALISAGLAVVEIARSDADGEVHAAAIRLLRTARAQRGGTT